ncbi:hypothetical protein ACQP2K_22120 [Microbispora siamensis]
MVQTVVLPSLTVMVDHRSATPVTAPSPAETSAGDVMTGGAGAVSAMKALRTRMFLSC